MDLSFTIENNGIHLNKVRCDSELHTRYTAQRMKLSSERHGYTSIVN